MKYRTAFQCPITGETVIAVYQFGTVRMQAADDAQDPDTFAYCAEHSGTRIASLDAAQDWIDQVSDGQSLGFEKSRY